MQHTKDCPHNCKACEQRWDIATWIAGGCPICGIDKRGFVYACIKCFIDLSVEDQADLIAMVQDSGHPW